jgi:hypothetical protein
MLEAIEVAAEQSGKTLSQHALGRFLRELFGDRPEPWMELDARDDAPDIVTVTGQSVIRPDALVTDTSPSQRLPTPISEHIDDVEAELRSVVQLRKPTTLEDGSGSSMPQVATLGSRWSGPISAVGLQPTLRASVPPPAGPPGPTPVPPNPPGAPLPLAGRESNLPTTYPTYEPSLRELGPTVVAQPPIPEPIDVTPRSRRAAVLIVIPTVLIGVGILFAISDRGPRSPSIASGGTSDAAVFDPAIATTNVARSAWHELDAAPTPVVAAVDAATVAVALVADAPPAAVQIDAPPPDAGAIRAAALAAIKRDARAGDWAGAWKTCSEIKRKDLTIDARAACAQAACGKKKRSDAIGFLRGLPRARRSAVAKVCAAQGVDLHARGSSVRDKDPCEIDPLSCQH